jgi:predicted nucleic acid-binding protein
MRPRVYLETTVVSYLTAWPSRDVVVAGHQQVTREWWSSCQERFEYVISALVLREASAGDAQAAADRLAVLKQLTVLTTTSEALALAKKLVDDGAIPQNVPEDALHLAVAASSGVEYLVTWNYRHLANATMRRQIAECCQEAGFASPIICTPEELVEQEK